MAEPPAKRLKTAPSAGGEAAASLPGSRMLRQTMLVLLFLVRVSDRSADTLTAGLAQIGTMVQRHIDRAFHRYNEMISRKLESFQGQIEGLRHEVRHLARLCSNRYVDQQTRVDPNQEHAAADGSKTNIRLRFLNELKLPIYTEKNITDENNAAIKLAMFEGDKMITSGTLSMVKVEILVLRGDFSNSQRDNWTEEEFDKHIAQGRDGQDLVLGTVCLNNGEVELSQIRFKEGSCRRKFIMAARVCKNTKPAGRVQEAITKPVTVLDRRNEPNEKRHPPSLDDAVYRLEEIAKNGVYHKRLLENGISTVESFLKALNKDHDELRKILNMKKQQNSWLKLIKHANDCVLGDKQELKQYQNEQGDVVLYFNCVHSLVGAAFPHDYVDSKGFNLRQKALVNSCKGHAYNILDDIPPNYVMTDNIPQPITPGTGPAENWPRDVSNPVSEPIFPTTNYGPTIASHDIDDLITQDYQGQTSLPDGRQQIPSPSIGCDWQKHPQGLMDSADLLDQLEIARVIDMLQQPSGASTSAQPYHDSHHLPHPHQMAPATAPAWTMVAPAQPSFADQEQGPSCPAFPDDGGTRGVQF
ncbi:hypothetical protein ACP70R_033491 [Stipagrostis hirtigluma subsp. patula]